MKIKRLVPTYIITAALFALGLWFGNTLHAQVVPAAYPQPPVSVAPSGFTALLANPDLWATLIALVSGLVAIWKHKEAGTANAALTASQKVTQSLVLGIETATRLPEVQAAEAKVKAVIQAKATEYGVQPILHRIVQDLTEPGASSGGTTDSHA